MNRNFCILNIGNTHVEILVREELTVVPTGDFTPEMIPGNIPCAAASVVPAVTNMLKNTRNDIFWVTCETPGLPDLSLVQNKSLGADRIANIAKLSIDGILPAVTVDCGTAITCEIVDEKRTYRGGCILPGRALLRKSLHLFTAQLPEIPLYAGLPENFPGISTNTDMRWGTDGMAAAAVKDIINRTQAMFPEKRLRIVICGGDAEFFLPYFPDAENGGSFFTLKGIKALYLHSLK